MDTNGQQEPSSTPEPGQQQQTGNTEPSSNRFNVGAVVLATLAVLGILVLSYVIYSSLTILLLLFLALLVATAIEPLVNWLRRGPFTRSTGILIVYTGLFLLLGGIGYVLFAVFFSQLGDLSTTFNSKLQAMHNDLAPLAVSRVVTDTTTLPTGQAITVTRTVPADFMSRQLLLLVEAGQAGLQKFSSGTPPTPDAKLEAVTTTTLTAAEIFFGVVTVFVVAYYWLTERTLIKRAFITWFPARNANRIRRVWDDIEVKVGGWVRGQFTLMATVGTLSLIGYFVLGVKYWIALALFIGLAEAIPLIGPYIGTAPAVLVAFTQDSNDGLLGLLGVPNIDTWVRALLVVIFAVILQNIEGNVLVPRVMKNSVGISPLTVLLSILIGATLAGLAGALIAVPLAGALQVVLGDMKAARESTTRLEEVTAAAEETREDAGELVVAYPAPRANETKAKVEGKARTQEG